MKTNILGRWSLVSVYYQEFKNIDSLKEELSKKELSEIFSVFNVDNSFTDGENGTVTGSYSIDSLTCDLISKTNRHGQEASQKMKIVSADDGVLIVTQKSEKNVLTFGFRKIAADSINCNSRKILGEWHMITMFNSSVVRIDSVKQLPKDFPKIRAVWKFDVSGQYFSDIKGIKENGVYSFDGGICEVKIQNYIKGEKRVNDYQIYFLDSSDLILRQKVGKNFYRYIYFKK